MIQANFCWK